MNQLSSLSKPANANVHKLEGKAWKQWWQIADIFKLRQTPLDQDRYQNVAIRSQITFLLTLPFFMALQYHAVGPESVKMLIMAGSVGAIMLIMLYLSFKKHCRYVLSVKADENGLFVQSPVYKRRINWLAITDSYINQNGDCELILRDGSEFILSRDLTDSAKLFEQIAKIKINSGEMFTYNYRFPGALIDGATIACLALVVAFVFPILTGLFYPSRDPQSAINALKVAILAVPLVLAYWRINLTNFAEVVRTGPNYCSIRTRTQCRHFGWNEARKIRQLGGIIFITTRHGFFAVLAGKKEPVAQKLLEGQKYSLLG